MLILAKKKVWFYSLQRIKKGGTKIDNEVEIQVFFILLLHSSWDTFSKIFTCKIFSFSFMVHLE